MHSLAPAKYRSVVGCAALARFGSRDPEQQKIRSTAEDAPVLVFVSVDGVHCNVYLGPVTSGAFHVHTVPTAAIGLEASSSTDFFNEWYDSNLNSFLSELYFKSSSEGVDKYSLLSMLFDRIEGAFVSRDLVEIDKLLEAFEPSKTLDVVSVGVLRSTFRAKARLKSWQGCLARVIKYMDDSGRDWKRQLRGLINSHDTFVRTNYAAVL